METLDIAVIVLYILVVLVIGYLSGRKSKTEDDFFLAGRSMPWLPIALSVAATMISANSFIGGPGWAYNSGMAPFMINIAVPLACFFAMWITIPIIYRLKVVSIYQYMTLRFGTRARILLIAQFFINSIIQVSSMVFIPSLLLQIMTGWKFELIVPLIVICAIIYTTLGGIKAVIWTDMVQMMVVWGSVIMIIIIALNSMDTTLKEVIDIASLSGKLNTLNLTFDLKNNNAFFVTLIGGTIMWVRYFCFDQIQVQRILTSKSIKDVKSSLLSSSIIMNVIYFLLLFIGIILWSFYNGKEFESSNMVMIDFVLNHVPVGFLGLIVSGSLAAAMSSVDSILNSMTTVFVKDIYEVHFKKNKEKSSKNFVTIISIVMGIIIILFVIIGFGGSVKSVLDVVGAYISYFTGPACAISILAIFSKKSNDKGVSIGFILGIILGIIISRILNPGWLWNPIIGFTTTIVLGYIFSIILGSSKVDKEKANKYTLYGVRHDIKVSNDLEENGVSLEPGKLDKYSIITLIFFLSQYLILFLIQK